MAEPHLLQSVASAPLDDPANDRLGRGEFANRVYRLLIDCPPEWPVRVGLMGDWGEGKTTVARFVVRLARADGHLVVEYPVSTQRSIEDLWTGFAVALCRAINEAGLPIEPHLLPLRRLDLARVTSKGKKRVEAGFEIAGFGAAALSGVPQLAAMVRSALTGGTQILQEALGIDEQTVSQICALIPEQHRIIVILDDLDRVDPRLVPEILLRLRDLLELPRFSFLVPYDPLVITRTLEHQNVAWKPATRFLEKIFDYQIELPKPSQNARWHFFLSEINQHCPFLNQHLDSLTKLREILPSNPRRIRSFVRHLYLLRDELVRYDRQELDWWTLFCLELLRVVGPMQRTRALSVIDEYRKRPARIVEETSDERQGGERKTRYVALRSHLLADASREFGEDASPSAGDAERVLKAWADSARFDYLIYDESPLSPLERPALVTRKEARDQFASWKAERELTVLIGWCTDRAQARSTRISEVVFSLISRLISFRNDLLGSMSHASAFVIHEKFASDAANILSLIGLLWNEQTSNDSNDSDRVIVLREILDQVGSWIRFDKNPADRTMREREFNFVHSILSDSGHSSLKFAEALEEFSRHRVVTTASWTIAVGQFEKALSTPLATCIQEWLKQPQGADILFNQNAPSLVTKVVFSSQTPFWAEITSGNVFGSEPAIAAENAIALLEAALANVNMQDERKTTVLSFITDQERVRYVWRIATSVRMQYRAFSQFEEIRAKLIQHGTPASIVELPVWLVAEPETAPFHECSGQKDNAT